MPGSKVYYVSSKLKHRDMWRNCGINTNSSWLQTAEIAGTDALDKMWNRYFSELVSCDALVLYLEPGEVPKGCLIELGAAMSNSKPIYIVWDHDVKELEKMCGTIIYHKSVKIVDQLSALV